MNDIRSLEVKLCIAQPRWRFHFNGYFNVGDQLGLFSKQHCPSASIKGSNIHAAMLCCVLRHNFAVHSGMNSYYYLFPIVSSSAEVLVQEFLHFVYLGNKVGPCIGNDDIGRSLESGIVFVLWSLVLFPNIVIVVATLLLWDKVKKLKIDYTEPMGSRKNVNIDFSGWQRLT